MNNRDEADRRSCARRSPPSRRPGEAGRFHPGRAGRRDGDPPDRARAADRLVRFGHDRSGRPDEPVRRAGERAAGPRPDAQGHPLRPRRHRPLYELLGAARPSFSPRRTPPAPRSVPVSSRRMRRQSSGARFRSPERPTATSSIARTTRTRRATASISTFMVDYLTRADIWASPTCVSGQYPDGRGDVAGRRRPVEAPWHVSAQRSDRPAQRRHLQLGSALVDALVARARRCAGREHRSRRPDGHGADSDERELLRAIGDAGVLGCAEREARHSAAARASRARSCGRARRTGT